MKIDPQVYERMKSDIAALATHHKIDVATADGGKTGLKTMWTLLDSARRNRAYDNNHPAFKSGQWPRVLPYDGSEYTVYYKGGCNDSHVETALRKIKKELSEQRNVARPVLKPGFVIGRYFASHSSSLSLTGFRTGRATFLCSESSFFILRKAVST